MMRVDARHGGHDWYVWDCERCQTRFDVLWADDEMNALCVYVLPFGMETVIEHKRCVALYADRKLVLVNPVEDSKDADWRIEMIGTTEEQIA